MPEARAVAFLDAILTFKIENRNLIRALEFVPGLLQSEHYQWMHGVLCAFLLKAMPKGSKRNATYSAHALLASIHIDLIETMIADGLSYATIKQSQAAHVRAMLLSSAEG